MTESVVRVAAAGLKEADASFNSLMGSLFAPLPKKRVKELGMTEEEEGRYVSRLSKDLDASGSVDKIALGRCAPPIIFMSSCSHSVRLF